MALSNCTKCKDIPKAFGILEIGTVGVSTAYRVYFKNLANDIETIYDLTSDSNGLLTLQYAAEGFDLSGGWYEIAVVDATKYYIGHDQDITIEGVAYDCLRVRLVDIDVPANTQAEFSYIKLVVA